MLLFVLAQIAHCESSHLCPTKQQVLEAVIERDNEAFGSESVSLSVLDQDMELVKTTNDPKISDIECIGVDDTSEPAVDCRYTVKCRAFAAYEITTLKLIASGRWRIVSYKHMTRRRR